MNRFKYQAYLQESLPTRERGLKDERIKNNAGISKVAPYAGAWIESSESTILIRAWRESLPTRERGLKVFLRS